MLEAAAARERKAAAAKQRKAAAREKDSTAVARDVPGGDGSVQGAAAGVAPSTDGFPFAGITSSIGRFPFTCAPSSSTRTGAWWDAAGGGSPISPPVMRRPASDLPSWHPVNKLAAAAASRS